jgi:hypothetical protein
MILIWFLGRFPKTMLLGCVSVVLGWLSFQPQVVRSLQSDYRYLQSDYLQSDYRPPEPKGLAQSASEQVLSVVRPVPDAPVLAVNDLYRVLADSPVTSGQTGGRVLATVHQSKYVHIIGSGNGCYRVQLRSGITGFVAAAKLEYVRGWDWLRE